jgi:hypothetical protein
MTYGILVVLIMRQKGENSEKWHQSFGGGLWLNGLNVITARITYFKKF